jgi:hypothetical protein
LGFTAEAGAAASKINETAVIRRAIIITPAISK